MITAFISIWLSVWSLIPTFHVCDYRPLFVIDKAIVSPHHKICIECWKMEPCKKYIGTFNDNEFYWTCLCGRRISQ